MAKCLLGSKKFDQHLLVTVEDMVSIEHKTVKETKISFYDLMERSGKAVSKEILDHFPKPQKTIVLCGPGNNGGDGFVVARFLKEAGWPVTVAIPPAYGRWSDSATAHKALWTEKCTDLNPEITSGFDIIIDGLFGIGLDRPLKEPYVDIIKTANQQKAFRVSIDIPSGIDGATGALLGVAFNADLTVTFGHKKLGHALLPGRSHTGICKIHDIGFVAPDDTQRKIYLNHPDLWKSAYPYPKIEGHKYTRGHGVILGGSTFTGAARLAAMAARRIGAGLISIATSPEAQEIYATSSPGILLSILAHTHDFEELVKDDRKNAYLLGPGFLGGNRDLIPSLQNKVRAVLGKKRSCILDADVFTAFEKHPKDLFAAIKSPCVMTPHTGEFSRLFNDKGSRISQAQEASKLSKAILVLKGPDTVIADPSGHTIIENHGTPFLATGGTGDVLSGMILGLLAQDMDPFHASAMATWIHSEASDLIGLGLLAEDIPDCIPEIMDEVF